MVPEQVILSAGEGALAALVYAMLWYAKSRGDGETFDPYKFAATLVVGVAVGAVLGASGVAVTETAIEVRLVAYAGVISLVEAVLKAAHRRWRRRNG